MPSHSIQRVTVARKNGFVKQLVNVFKMLEEEMLMGSVTCPRKFLRFISIHFHFHCLEIEA